MSQPSLLLRPYLVGASPTPTPTPTLTPTLNQARAVLAAQPFSRLLGTYLSRVGADGAVLELQMREHLTQQHGFVHGGVVSYLVDNAITFSAGVALGVDLVAAGFTVDYLRPARGVGLAAHARVIKAGAALAVLRCDVHAVEDDGRAELYAVGQGRVSRRLAHG